MTSDARQGLAKQGNYAGALSRLLAYGADLLIANTIYAVAIAIIEFAINTATPWTVELHESYIVIVVGGIAWFGFYLGASWAAFARSPGMSLLGLRIVHADGSPLTPRRAIIRLIAFPLGFLTLGIGFLGIIFGKAHRALYDRIAGTAVIYDWDAEAARLRELATRGARRREVEFQAPPEG